MSSPALHGLSLAVGALARSWEATLKPLRSAFAQLATPDFLERVDEFERRRVRALDCECTRPGRGLEPGDYEGLAALFAKTRRVRARESGETARHFCERYLRSRRGSAWDGERLPADCFRKPGNPAPSSITADEVEQLKSHLRPDGRGRLGLKVREACDQVAHGDKVRAELLRGYVRRHPGLKAANGHRPAIANIASQHAIGHR